MNADDERHAPETLKTRADKGRAEKAKKLTGESLDERALEELVERFATKAGTKDRRFGIQ